MNHLRVTVAPWCNIYLFISGGDWSLVGWGMETLHGVDNNRTDELWIGCWWELWRPPVKYIYPARPAGFALVVSTKHHPVAAPILHKHIILVELGHARSEMWLGGWNKEKQRENRKKKTENEKRRETCSDVCVLNLHGRWLNSLGWAKLHFNTLIESLSFIYEIDLSAVNQSWSPTDILRWYLTMKQNAHPLTTNLSIRWSTASGWRYEL